MHRLVHELGMLTGLTVCYGNAWHSACLSTGLKREMVQSEGRFVQAPLPLDAATVFDIASLSKLFTLVAVLQLVVAGSIRMEDSIQDLDSRFVHLKDCSLHDCLSYLAQLKSPERLDAQDNAEAAQALLFQTRRHPLQGMRLYSDMNALVLGYVLEAVTGKTLYGLLEEQILKPCGMGETWARVPKERKADLADFNFEHRLIKGQYQLLDQALPGLPHDPKARLLGRGGERLSGHAGLFSTAKDLCSFAQALLSGRLLPMDVVLDIGRNRTGYLKEDGTYRQFLGLLCFAKSPLERLSELPPFMSWSSFGISGYTGHHLAIDPVRGVFDLFLGNRCHQRLSQVDPEQQAEALGLRPDGSGQITWPDGRQVRSSFKYVYQKDALLHSKVSDCLLARGWMQACS